MSKNINLQSIVLPKSIQMYKGRLFIDRSKIYCSIKFNKREYLFRVLIDKYNNPQFICGFDFINSITPGEINESLPNRGFISKGALKLWEELLYPVTPTEIQRSSDKALINAIKENSYDVFEDFFN